jgi:hypothetical protein
MVKKETLKIKIENNNWFKPRTWCGWGFVPINWKGVSAYMILILLTIVLSLIFNLWNATTSRGIEFLISFIILLILFTYIASKKTDKTMCECQTVFDAIKQMALKIVIIIAILIVILAVFYFKN